MSATELITTASMNSSKTLVHLLRARGELHPDRIAFTFLADGEDEEQNLTFGELDRRARVVAAELAQRGVSRTRALIIYESGLEYITALLGCLYANVAAVPVYPPDPMRAARTTDRLQTILQNAEPQVILTTTALRHWGTRLPKSRVDPARVLSTDTFDYDCDPPWIDPGLTDLSIAIVQYTSGSTNSPKGCVITHRNLLYNFRHVQRFDEPDAIAVSWLPMYHDMGLIGTVLQACHSGRRLVFMSPMSFVQRPYRWLAAISKYRAYATAGPNFGYELCVRKISDEELQWLDLSCLTLACNGAEPIRPDTVRRFTERFAVCGLRPEALYPCYGLAEATLIVAGGAKAELPVIRTYSTEALALGRAVTVRDSQSSKSTVSDESVQLHRSTPPAASTTPCTQLVGSGKAVAGTIVRIVNPETRMRCADGTVGEIWVDGPGVAAGYWNAPAETEETFGGRIVDSEEGPFLRTGDLGFLDDGELFVVGRKKDLIIVNGRNHYPQDIELTIVQSHRSLRRDSGVAFAIDVNDEERLVVVQELTRYQRADHATLLAELHRDIVRNHGLAPYAIVLIRGGTLPKTSSGKLQRQECRSRYLNNELTVVAQWQEGDGGVREDEGAQNEPAHVSFAVGLPSRNRTTKPSHDELLDVVRQLLHQLKPNVSPLITLETYLFGDLGLASIDALALQGLVEEYYQCQFPFHEFMADLGKRQARDARVDDFVTFLHRHFPIEPAPVPSLGKQGDSPPLVH
jgi:acyl-CoA synthetase (AMP-forming)/AMP-acid ligase II/acyl carrier protein